jgi:hypothetical protein
MKHGSLLTAGVLRIDLKDCITSFNSHLGEAEDEAAHDLMLLAGLNYRIPLGRR